MSENKWGERAEVAREQLARERERLLKDFSPAGRESAEKLLDHAEGSFKGWYGTVAIMALASAGRRGGGDEQLAVFRTTLDFYRLAVLADDVGFWQATLTEHGAEGLPGALAWAERSAHSEVQKSAGRLKLLLEAGRSSHAPK